MRLFPGSTMLVACFVSEQAHVSISGTTRLFQVDLTNGKECLIRGVDALCGLRRNKWVVR